MDKNNELPLLILSELAIMPNTSVSVRINDDRNIKALDYAVNNNTLMYLCVENNQGYREYGVKIGISRILKMDESVVKLMVEGLERIKFVAFDIRDNVVFGKAITLIDNEDEIDESKSSAFREGIIKRIERISEITQAKPANHIIKGIKESKSLSMVINMTTMLTGEICDKYQILAVDNMDKRALALLNYLEDELAVVDVMQSIDDTVQKRLTKHNKEFILREQKKVIEEQLGDGDREEVKELRDAVVALACDEAVKNKLLKEVERLAKVNDSAPESAIIRNYLEWVIGLPWDKVSDDNKDLNLAQKIFDEDHYGIEKVKERIIEFLAVRTLTGGNNAGVSICLVGPPGVGKTTIAKSIARALEKEFVQLTLGGVHDEAEIRGHRKTYLGAMPGRIMSSLAKCKTNNPVFLLDEVDKITKDMRGDPQSALLEVLDPNQNKQFRDNYLEIPYDISSVMFIVTANDLSNIDKPLLDRLEVIHLDGYTPDEKLNIAKKHLIKKQIVLNGINEKNLTLTDGAIIEIIEGYTREAGVRELERQIANICRKCAYDIVVSGKKDKKFVVKTNNVDKYLKKRIYQSDNNSIVGEVGRVVGLAWNGYGGSSLNIEVTVLPGMGDLNLTGNLGDVMRESALTALSVVRKRAGEFGFGYEFFKSHDIHIHVPMGAVPKDGPSAGITLTTAIMSAIMEKPVMDKYAMTGEVTLSGRVMAIGGLKEKSLAADRIGIKHVIIPYDNVKDLDEIPQSIKNSIEFIPVNNVDEVLQRAVQGYGN